MAKGVPYLTRAGKSTPPRVFPLMDGTPCHVIHHGRLRCVNIGQANCPIRLTDGSSAQSPTSSIFSLVFRYFSLHKESVMQGRRRRKRDVSHEEELLIVPSDRFDHKELDLI
jgi:hypothetical protein